MQLIRQNSPTLSKTSAEPSTSSAQRIVLALGEMAIFRSAATPNSQALVMFAKRLACENEAAVLKALTKLGESPRREGQTAFPDLGTILETIRDIRGRKQWHTNAEGEFVCDYVYSPE